MEKQVTYILNEKTYLYILEFDGYFEYTFYNDTCKVTETGRMEKNDHLIDDALKLICRSYELKVNHIHKLNDIEFKEFAETTDDYEWVSVI
jgi:hypothetical protein